VRKPRLQNALFQKQCSIVGQYSLNRFLGSRLDMPWTKNTVSTNAAHGRSTLFNDAVTLLIDIAIFHFVVPSAKH
jgi:hypothetical protein